MHNRRMRTSGRSLFTAVVATLVAATALVATAPAAAEEDDAAAAYYAAVEQAVAGRVPTPEQENANTVAGLEGTFAPAAASDANPAKFVDGDLVSDAVFFRGNAWSEATIQSFLNGKVAACAATTGPACLKSYSVATTAKTADAMCSGYTPDAAKETAAHILARVAVSCGINPVVLLVMMQKEQGLVSSTAPTQTMYNYATGWNCPDTALGCSANTAATTGLFNQLYGAAWQFKRYGNPAGTSKTFTWYPVGKVSALAYNVASTCGKKKVAVQNKATAALYYYTPYTPNAASLASYPGEGNACSAYGIRNFWMLFNAWYGSSTAGSVPNVARTAGSDRFETSVAVSRAAYPTPGAGIPAAYIANGYAFPDALGAAPAAAKRGGPLLLSAQNAVPAKVMAELARLKPATILVAGGQAAISDAAVRQLQGLRAGQKVVRVSGSDRFETSRAIASNAFGTSASTAYLASGMNFPDALSAGAAAGAKRMPVILVAGGAPDAATIAGLRAMRITSVKLIGGTSAVPASYGTALTKAGFSVGRISGSDRFATSLAVSADAFPNATSVTFFASGMAFPDALSGAAYAAKAGAPLLVTQPGCVTAGSAQLALRSGAIRLLGGASALGGAVGSLSICQ